MSWCGMRFFAFGSNYGFAVDCIFDPVLIGYGSTSTRIADRIAGMIGGKGKYPRERVS